MSTRGAIVRLTTETTFQGRYHHYDSYPDGLGKTLWDLYHGYFNKDIDKMLKVLIDEHPAGWSTINDADFNLSPGFHEHENLHEFNNPKCYCHGDKHEQAWLVNEKNASGSGCEYVYAFYKNKHNHIMVLSSYCENDTKMIGMFGAGDNDAVWKQIADVDLDDNEPDWGKMTD